MYRIDPENIKAVHLIEKILDLKVLTNPNEPWTEQYYSDNFPRLLRLKQIKCLSNIFCPELSHIQDLRLKAENILIGSFIENRALTEYAFLIDKINKSEKIEIRDIEEIKELYLNLIDFKITAEKFINYNGSVSESYGIRHFPIKLQNEITQQIDLTKIDEILNLIIDPLNRIITKQKLINNYNYPEGDSFDADIDWM